MESNYSLSDLAAVTNENGLGGSNAFVLILLFAMIFGNGGLWGGRGAGDYGQFATAASQQEILFGQQFQNLDNKMDRLGNGISDATFALNNTVIAEGRNTQNAIGDVSAAIAQVRYDMATQNAATNAAIHAEGEATRNMMQQNKIESLQAQVNQLQTAQMLCGIPKINPNAWGVYAYPTQCGCAGTSLATI